MSDIELVHGDITGAQVDAIVNAANTAMLGGGGVDGAIHRAAGPELLKACKAVPEVDGVRCPTGEARITPAGKLAAKFVIHTVGPRFGIDKPEAELLASAYRSSLRLAIQNHCESIAFPAISCGVYAYPLVQASAIAIHACSDEEFESLAIKFYLFDEQTYFAWQSAEAAAQIS